MGDKAKNYELPTVPLLINGVETVTSQTFEVVSPDTSKPVWACSSASREDAIVAVKAAARAFPKWSSSKIDERRRIFLRAAEILEARTQDATDYMAKETGSLLPFGAFNVNGAIELLKEIAGRISAALTGSIPVCSDVGTMALVLKEPYGVVLGIAPWYVTPSK